MPTLQNREAALLDAYYADELACTAGCLETAATAPTVVSCAARDEPVGPRVSPVVMVLRVGGGRVASSAPRFVDAVRAALAALPTGMSEAATAAWAGERLAAVLAEAHPGAWALVSRVLTVGRQVPGRGRRGAGGEPGERDVRSDEDRRRFWALAPPGDRAAYVEVLWFTKTVANIQVETWPRFRRMGYGRAAVAEALRAVCRRGGAPLYLHRVDNRASAALADALGLVTYGWVVEATALDLPAEDLRRLPPGSRGAVVARGVFEQGRRTARWRRVHPQERLLGSEAVGRTAEGLCAALAVPGRVAVLRAVLRAWGSAHEEDLARECGLAVEEARAHCLALEAAGLVSGQLGGAFAVWPHQVAAAMSLLGAAAELTPKEG